MLDMCKYNMASQQNSTTQSTLFKGLQRALHNLFIQIGVTRPDTQVIQSYKHMRKQLVWVQTTSKIKEAWKAWLYYVALHKIRVTAWASVYSSMSTSTKNPSEGVAASFEKCKLKQHEYKGTQQDLQQILHTCIVSRMVGGVIAASQL